MLGPLSAAAARSSLDRAARSVAAVIEDATGRRGRRADRAGGGPAWDEAGFARLRGHVAGRPRRHAGRRGRAGRGDPRRPRATCSRRSSRCAPTRSPRRAPTSRAGRPARLPRFRRRDRRRSGWPTSSATSARPTAASSGCRTRSPSTATACARSTSSRPSTARAREASAAAAAGRRALDARGAARQPVRPGAWRARAGVEQAHPAGAGRGGPAGLSGWLRCGRGVVAAAWWLLPRASGRGRTAGIEGGWVGRLVVSVLTSPENGFAVDLLSGGQRQTHPEWNAPTDCGQARATEPTALDASRSTRQRHHGARRSRAAAPRREPRGHRQRRTLRARRSARRASAAPAPPPCRRGGTCARRAAPPHPRPDRERQPARARRAVGDLGRLAARQAGEPGRAQRPRQGPRRRRRIPRDRWRGRGGLPSRVWWPGPVPPHVRCAPPSITLDAGPPATGTT